MFRLGYNPGLAEQRNSVFFTDMVDSVFEKDYDSFMGHVRIPK